MRSKPCIRKCRPDGLFAGAWSVYYGRYRVRGSAGPDPVSTWRDFCLMRTYMSPVEVDLY